MVKFIYHDTLWSSNQDTSNVFFTGFVGNGNTQTIQESNQFFNWTHDNNNLMKLTAEGNLNVSQSISTSNIQLSGNIVPTETALYNVGSSNNEFMNIFFSGVLPSKNVEGSLLNVRCLQSDTSNYIPTNGTKKIIAYVLGGGGGGGGTLSNTYSAGGGGGAGGLCISYVNDMSNIHYECYIGKGGLGTSNDGIYGENSYFIANNVSYVGLGGGGGVKGTYNGIVGFSVGGTTSNSVIPMYGENGGAGIGKSSFLLSGQGGSTTFGRGGASLCFTNNGFNAVGYGSGGGGGANENTNSVYTGGNGADGVILIQEYS